ncbi:hypothetical protein EPN29_09615 [bacterium]|nr:MAG: hypothetical protein EPN29_09615 [bacterium]
MRSIRVWLQAPIALVPAVVALGASCAFGTPATFSLSNVSVDSTYACPPGANNAAYDLHATIDAHNGTSNLVTIESVGAVMILAAVKGAWLEHVGDRYDAGRVAFTPSTVGAGTDGQLKVTVPSACTNQARATRASDYGEYSVEFTVTTSAGKFMVQSRNRHRIAAA